MLILSTIAIDPRVMLATRYNIKTYVVPTHPTAELILSRQKALYTRLGKIHSKRSLFYFNHSIGVININLFNERNEMCIKWNKNHTIILDKIINFTNTNT